MGADGVRTTDVATRLNVSKASVTQAMGNLVRAGLALQERYGPVELTEAGYAKAASVRRRHELLRSLFEDVLGVDPETADADACRVEHAISPVTLEKLAEFLKRRSDR